jgi:hypothetical protein
MNPPLLTSAFLNPNTEKIIANPTKIIINPKTT